MKKLLVIALLLCALSTAFAMIKITGIDVSGFPQIKMYVMSDEGPITDVTDEGNPMNFTSTKVGSIERPDVDIVFVFDTTGSMTAEIADLKTGAISFANKLFSAGINARLGLVTFGDEIRLVKDFTPSVEAFKTWVDGLIALGGGDPLEISLDAMIKALSLSYRPGAQKVMILVTDAPYHYRGDGTPFSKFVMSEVKESLKDFGVTFFAVSPNHYVELVDHLGGVWINIEKERNFSQVLDSISVMLADQYEITYRVEDLTPNKLHRVTARAVNTARGEYVSPDRVSVDLNKVSATGLGVVPFYLAGTAQGYLSARTAAIIDAQRCLLEVIMGVKITATETVEDGILKDRRINTAVRGLVSGAFIEEEEYLPAAGIYRVKLRVDLLGETGLINILRNLDFYRESEGLMVNDSFTLKDLRGGWVKAVGFGVVDPDVDSGRATYKARNAAIADAQVRLLEVIEGSFVDSNVRVHDFTSYTVIRREVEGRIRGAEIISEKVLSIPEYQIEGLYMVEMAVSLTQRLGIMGVLLNEFGLLDGHAVREELKKEADKLAGLGTITGLVIEAAGMGIVPAMFPRIFTESGELIYSIDSTTADAVSVMDYVATVAEARAFGRAGENPHSVKAVEVDGSDIYISDEDANTIKEMIKRFNFFRNGAVVAVIGG